MKNNYWQNKRRKEANKCKPVIHSKVRRISFSVDDVNYVYEFKSDNSSGFAKIYKGTEIIYSEITSQCSEEGTRVYNLLRENNLLGI